MTSDPDRLKLALGELPPGYCKKDTDWLRLSIALLQFPLFVFFLKFQNASIANWCTLVENVVCGFARGIRGKGQGYTREAVDIVFLGRTTRFPLSRLRVAATCQLLHQFFRPNRATPTARNSNFQPISTLLLSGAIVVILIVMVANFFLRFVCFPVHQLTCAADIPLHHRRGPGGTTSIKGFLPSCITYGTHGL